MLNSKTEALGIIFPNSYDAMVPDLVSERLMASIPFASRYRMCDFILSSMVHSGIDNISIIVRKNYHSLLDHLGAGREWDLVRKNGGLNIVPPFAQKQVKVFEGRINILITLKCLPENLTVPASMAYGYTKSEHYPSVVVDDKKGAYEIVNYVISMGHKNIGVITGKERSIHTHDRLLGYQKALYDHSFFLYRWEMNCQKTEKNIYSAMRFMV